MATSKFAAGDRVAVLARSDNPNIRPGIYQVVRPMPESREGRQYRVRNVMDEHERVFSETELTKV